MNKQTRRFTLRRDIDHSGVSGIGIVAEGVVWTDGRICLRWHGEASSINIMKSLEHMIQIHGHNGSTRVVWLDLEEA
jgi:hypothetical protein